MEKAEAQLRAGDLAVGAQELVRLLESPSMDCRAVAEFLDAQSHHERVATLAGLPRRLMRPWYEAAFHFLPMRRADLMPAGVPAFAPVEHVGVNNMPLARRFSKVMYADGAGRVAGYNLQRWGWATGPGYFTVEWHPFEAVVDYTVLPQQAPEGFPGIQSNAVGLSFFVYRGLRDTLRRVSRDVCVGHAVRLGQPLPNYFVLTRSAPPVAAGG